MIPQIIDANPDLLAPTPGTFLTRELMQPLMEVRDAFENTVNVARYNRTVGNAEQLNSATILAAIADLSGATKTLFFRRGSWTIDQNIDMSALPVRVEFEPGVLLSQYGGSTFKFPKNFIISDNRTYFAGATGFVSFPEDSSMTLRAPWWGATPQTLASNSTSALVAFEAACFGAKQKMVLQAGFYGFSGTWAIRRSLAGFGVLIKQLNASVQSSPTLPTILAEDIEGFSILGEIAIDSDFKRCGIYMGHCHGAVLEGLKLTNSVHVGIYQWACNNTRVSRCSSSFIRYSTVPSTGAPADAFYHRESFGNVYEDCTAYDFRRIGFVSEGSTTRSELPKYYRCLAEYANNSDDGNQVPGGFWAENTNGAEYYSCIAKNIDSGVGQAAARPAGFTVGSGTSKLCTFLYVGCRAEGNTNTDYGNNLGGGFGFFFTGANGHAIISMRDVTVSQAYQGIHIKAGLREVRVDGALLMGFRGAAAGPKTGGGTNMAGIFIDPGSIDTLAKVKLSDVREEDCTWHADGGTVIWASLAPSCVYELHRSRGIYHQMSSANGNVARIHIADCDVTYGSAGSRAGFTANIIHATGTTLRDRTGSTGRLFQAQSTGFHAWTLNCCEVYFQTNQWWQIQGSLMNLTSVGTWWHNGGLRVLTTGEWTITMIGGGFVEYSTDGAISGNGSAAPTRGFVKLISVDLRHSNPAIVPLKKFGANSPTRAYMVGCTTSATTLTDWDITLVNLNDTAV